MEKTDEKTLIVYCDGGARGNPGPAAAGCVISDLAGKKRFLCGKYLGRATNNQAEYEAVKLALEVIKSKIKDPRRAEFYLDSLLVTQQLRGLYKVKNDDLAKKLFSIRGLENSLGEIIYTHVRREKNKDADALVNKALDEESDFLITEEIQ